MWLRSSRSGAHHAWNLFAIADSPTVLLSSSTRLMFLSLYSIVKLSIRRAELPAILTPPVEGAPPELADAAGGVGDRGGCWGKTMGTIGGKMASCNSGGMQAAGSAPPPRSAMRGLCGLFHDKRRQRVQNRVKFKLIFFVQMCYYLKA